jgi:hypothetical protein
MDIMESLLCLNEIRQSTTGSQVADQPIGSKAELFIDHWKTSFGNKCKRNPHLALPVMHNVIGAILRDVRIYYDSEWFDLRTSLLVIQDSGTGKKPAMEFAEGVVNGVLPAFKIKRRRNITSAGAIGGLTTQQVVDEKKGTTSTEAVPVKGDLETVDFLSYSEAGSLLETKADSWGNDLLKDICESQDANNKLSKRLKDGEIPEFTSKTVLSLWTVPPANISTLVAKTGLIQRFIPVFKSIPFDEYRSLRNEIVSKLGNKVDEETNLKPIIDSLKAKPMITDFKFTEETKSAIIEKSELLDEALLAAGADYVDRLKSFTVRRDLLMVKLAIQHTWLDERNNVEPIDIEYAFKLMDGLWNSMLEFFIEKWNLENSTDKQESAFGANKLAATS